MLQPCLQVGVRTGELGAQADRAGAIHPGLGQGDAGCLPQAPGQLAGLLHQHVSGDNRQVEGQQLMALDRLSWVALAVIAQELPGGGKGRRGFRGRATVLPSKPMASPSTMQVPSPHEAPAPRPVGPSPPLAGLTVQASAAGRHGPPTFGFLLLCPGSADSGALRMPQNHGGSSGPQRRHLQRLPNGCQQQDGQQRTRAPHSLPPDTRSGYGELFTGVCFQLLGGHS